MQKTTQFVGSKLSVRLRDARELKKL